MANKIIKLNGEETIIECCGDCPNKATVFMGAGYRCNNTKNIVGVDIIDDECPLEDGYEDYYVVETMKKFIKEV